MSTSKTGNLGLCQWELEDPFLMEEMNEDNRKIDRAVVAVPLVTLMEVTLGQEAATVELDLSGVDLTQYMELWAYCSRTDARLRPNGYAENYTYLNSYGNWQNGTAYIPSRCGLIKAVCAAGLNVKEDQYFFGDDWFDLPKTKTGPLHALNYHLYSGSFAPGDTFKVVGVKK